MVTRLRKIRTKIDTPMSAKSSLYEQLGLSATASAEEIKRAYKVAALKYHPDKNNHSESAKAMFQQVAQAYEILGDVESRAIYDRYGTTDLSEIESIKQSNAMQKQARQRAVDPHLDAGDLFSKFFGSTGGLSQTSPFASSFFTSSFDAFTKPKKTKRGPNIFHEMKCSLRDLYFGKRAKLSLTRRRMCSKCNGDGSLRKEICQPCNGQGTISETRTMGPIMQSWSQTCHHCNGSGSFTDPDSVCDLCEGNGILHERKILELKVRPGTKEDEIFVFKGEADGVIDTAYGREVVIPGDAIITIRQIKDSSYRRVNKGQDLLIKNFKIDILTSLCGGSIYIVGHPSGKTLKVDIIPGEIIKEGCIKTLENMGMPKVLDNHLFKEGENESLSYGNLYVHFRVEYPERLNADTVEKLRVALLDDPYYQNSQAKVEAEKQIVENEVLNGKKPVEEHVFSDTVPQLSDIKQFESSQSFNKKTIYNNYEYDYKRRKYSPENIFRDFSDHDEGMAASSSMEPDDVSQ